MSEQNNTTPVVNIPPLKSEGPIQDTEKLEGVPVPAMGLPFPIKAGAVLKGRELEDAFDYLNVLIYGEFGVGKTWLAGSAVFVPDMRDILYISLEGGERGLKELIKACKSKGIDPNKHILVVPIQNFKQYAFLHEFLKQHIAARDSNNLPLLRRLEAAVRGYDVQNVTDAVLEQHIPEPKKFQTVITDSLTEAQKYCMYQILGIDPLTQKIDAEPESAQWGEWGKSREMVQLLVRRYRDMPINSIFICAKASEQDAKKQYHYTPMLPGQLANDVRGLLDTVIYMDQIPQEGGQILRRCFLNGGFYGGAWLAAKHRFGSNLKSLWLDNISMVDIWKLASM